MKSWGNVHSIKKISIANIRPKSEVLEFENQGLELWIRKTSDLRIWKVANRYGRQVGFNLGGIKVEPGVQDGSFIYKEKF